MIGSLGSFNPGELICQRELGASSVGAKSPHLSKSLVSPKEYAITGLSKPRTPGRGMALAVME